ncbi:MAG TPA: ImmA/IrrE family metallo-endopeptidase, partial [Armatimonadota bacterium]|nr:ImmA/IrrE family metallo-endopeptidase [Armatimonadota bacterium]
MAAEAWLVRAAEGLWGLAGGAPTPPRDLNRLLRYGLRLRPIAISHLTLGLVAQHVPHAGLAPVAAERDRRLRGCLVVTLGRRLVFYDPEDPEDEQRYTLAHELAHLWLEVIEPRERVRALLGEGALQVLDGHRDPTPGERMQAVLHRVSLHRPLHLLERDGELGITQGGILLAEERADRLAVELLAPQDEARRVLPLPRASFAEWLKLASGQIVEQFRLPPAL